MKILDEKGKLFGKVNVIDLLVLIVILAAVILVGVKVLGGGSSGNSAGADSSSGSSAETRLSYTVRVTAQRKEVAEQISRFVDLAEGKKDQLMHGGDLVENAYVVDYWIEPCRYNVLADGRMEMIDAAAAEAAGLVDICLLVEAVVDDPVVSQVGTLEVRIGKVHILKTTHLEFATGFITDCEWEPIET